MPTITLKNIPDELYLSLKEAAERNRRSLNNEILYRLERGVQSERVSTDEFLESARVLREQTARYVVSTDELNRDKNEGRP